VLCSRNLVVSTLLDASLVTVGYTKRLSVSHSVASSAVICLRSDLLCVERDVKLLLTPALLHQLQSTRRSKFGQKKSAKLNEPLCPLTSVRYSSELYRMPRLKTVFGERAFSHAGPAVWNSLPASIQASTSTTSCCRWQWLLKTHLFGVAFM